MSVDGTMYVKDESERGRTQVERTDENVRNRKKRAWFLVALL
jgi:hypothetical protein